jgi:hypothetical protein
MLIDHLGIVGSRDAGFTLGHIEMALEGFLDIIVGEIVTGDAKGVDTLAKEYAGTLNQEPKIFEADWARYAKAAGHKRNERLVRYLAAKENSHLVAFWDGQSTGTKNALGWCIYYHLPYTVFTKGFFDQL